MPRTTAAPHGPAPRRAGACDDESGRIMLLTLGCVVLGLMIVAMVASATAVHLERKALYDLADVIALDAADGAAAGAVIGGATGDPGSATLTLTDADVRESVTAYLAAHPGTAAEFDGFRVAGASSPDGASARVTLVATSHPPLVRWFTESFDAGIGLSATSSAQARPHF
ncbi:hypothetical protein [Isoptericola sp. BMS4]|uniref:hypothetical protein n=1 Tax=Isoptericola sp. BMS4 TaxID=2527875 RepID=UPI001F10FE32|nr:hypothetical protein [Isoptericola sp. BMS4]